MARKLLTPEQDAYLRSIAYGKYHKDIVVLLNKRFDLSLTWSQVKTYCTNHKIKTGMYGKGAREPVKLLNDKQDKYLRRVNYGKTSIEVTELLNTKFCLNLTPKQIQAYRKNNNIEPCGLTGRFEKGHISYNKGKKMPGHGAPETFFKQGHRPHNAVPVGTVIIDQKDGYLKKKIAEPNKWKFIHVMVWEDANGPKPKGTAVIFLDQDKTNITLSNLTLVSRAELVRLNHRGLLSNDAEMSKSGIAVAKVLTRLGQLKRKAKKR